MGDGDGRKVEQFLARQAYFPIMGTCWESVAGMSHKYRPPVSHLMCSRRTPLSRVEAEWFYGQQWGMVYWVKVAFLFTRRFRRAYTRVIHFFSASKEYVGVCLDLPHLLDLFIFLSHRTTDATIRLSRMVITSVRGFTTQTSPI